MPPFRRHSVARATGSTASSSSGEASDSRMELRGFGGLKPRHLEYILLAFSREARRTNYCEVTPPTSTRNFPDQVDRASTASNQRAGTLFSRPQLLSCISITFCQCHAHASGGWRHHLVGHHQESSLDADDLFSFRQVPNTPHALVTSFLFDTRRHY